ncbi:MAG: adenylyltransferase/cytidyltransferase family protein [Candidatus Binatia bacterium]
MPVRVTVKPRFGMIHGRFQPFHNGHWEYLQLAAARCETLIIGITNPDPSQIAEEEIACHRHRADSNPYTFFERQLMIREALLNGGYNLDRIIFIPFPINFPDRWQYYVPSDVVHYVRIFSIWEQTKVDRLRAAGHAVEVLQEGIEKAIEATEVRRRMRTGEPWEELIPAATARVLRSIQEARAL